jgi:hydrogenase maturation protease
MADGVAKLRQRPLPGLETMSDDVADRTLVLGIGNVLLTDEGAGVRVIEYLAGRNPDLAGVTWMDGGTLSFTLATEVENAARLVVVDATELRAAPGTVQVFEDEAMDRMLGGHGRSIHEVGLIDLMDIARLTGRLPARRALVGIQPQRVEWGSDPTPVVAAAIPRAASAVAELLMKWTGTAVAA